MISLPKTRGSRQLLTMGRLFGSFFVAQNVGDPRVIRQVGIIPDGSVGWIQDLAIETWLVVWLPFGYIGNLIIPIDELIFFRGVAQPPTRNFWDFSTVCCEIFCALVCYLVLSSGNLSEI